MSARGGSRAEAFPGGHIGPPLRGVEGVPNQRELAQDESLPQWGGTEPAPYEGSGAGRCVRRRGAPGVWLPPAKFRFGIWGVSQGHPALRVQRWWCAAAGRCGHRPLRPAGGRGTARRVVVPYGWLRRAAAIALGSGAQRSVCASGGEGWAGIAAEITPKVSSNLGQSLSQPAADSSLYTREPSGT